MNVISHSHAICLFPRSTLLARLWIPAQLFGMTTSLAKYTGRNYVVPMSPLSDAHRALQDEPELNGTRRPGDLQCFTIKFHLVDQVTPSAASVEYRAPSVHGILFKHRFTAHAQLIDGWPRKRVGDRIRFSIGYREHRFCLGGLPVIWLETTAHIFGAAYNAMNADVADMLKIWTSGVTQAVP